MTILEINKPKQYTSFKSLCIGHFDGLHIAHKAILDKLDDDGAILSIGIENSTLTPHNFRDTLTNKPIFGIRLQDIKHLDAKSFLKILKNFFPNFNTMIVGYDFKMGKNRECDIECLKAIFKEIKIITIDEVKIDGISIHSSIIKNMIQNGNIKQANLFLGREYFISGNIIKGQGIGKKDFVATLNIENNNNFLLPENGVYATKITINSKDTFTITFIGLRASTDNNFAIETHILDKNQEIKTQKTLTIKFYDKIRNNTLFKSKDSLKKQISIDIENAKSILSRL